LHRFLWPLRRRFRGDHVKNLAACEPSQRPARQSLYFIEILPRFSDKRQTVEIAGEIQHHIGAYLLTITAMNSLVGIATALAMITRLFVIALSPFKVSVIFLAPS